MVAAHAGLAGMLPAELTSFVGRRAELAELRTLFADRRLVTICGPGGVGKSRIQVRFAATTPRACPDGAVFVDLSPATAHQHAIDALAAALAVERRDITSIVERIGSKRMLILLDNCEQIVEA